MLENMTTEEKVIAGITAVGIAALVFHKPTRNAVGLSDRMRAKGQYKSNLKYVIKQYDDMSGKSKVISRHTNKKTATKVASKLNNSPSGLEYDYKISKAN
jgi:hypothetical protein